VGIYEHVAPLGRGGGYFVHRHIFGASEPGDPVVWDWVLHELPRVDVRLRLMGEDGPDVPRPLATHVNPKRMQRQAARAMAARGMSTKAQSALSVQRDQAAGERKVEASERRAEAANEAWERRRAKARRRHRGR
jgi:hypothetical protein